MTLLWSAGFQPAHAAGTTPDLQACTAWATQYSDSASGPLALQYTAVGGNTVFFYLKVVNPGGDREGFKVTLTGVTSAWDVSMLDAEGADITSEITGTDGWGADFAASGCEDMTLRVLPAPTLTTPTPLVLTLTASNEADATATATATFTVDARLPVAPAAGTPVSGFRPDLQMARADLTNWIGVGVYGTPDSTGQMQLLYPETGTPATSYLCVSNNGDTAGTAVITAQPPSTTNWTLTYRDSDGTDVTSQVVSASGWSMPLTPGQVAPFTITILGAAPSGNGAGTNPSIRVTVTVADAANPAVCDSGLIQVAPMAAPSGAPLTATTPVLSAGVTVIGTPVAMLGTARAPRPACSPAPCPAPCPCSDKVSVKLIAPKGGCCASDAIGGAAVPFTVQVKHPDGETVTGVSVDVAENCCSCPCGVTPQKGTITGFTMSSTTSASGVTTETWMCTVNTLRLYNTDAWAAGATEATFGDGTAPMFNSGYTFTPVATCATPVGDVNGCAISVRVKNLDITNVSAPGCNGQYYILYKPDSANVAYNTASVTFKIDDTTQLGIYYFVTLYLWPTRKAYLDPSDYELTRMGSSTYTSPGTYTIAISSLPEDGTYNYDLRVVKCTNSSDPEGTKIDTQWFKSVDAGFTNDELDQTDMLDQYALTYTIANGPILADSKCLILENDDTVASSISGGDLPTSTGDHTINFMDPAPDSPTRTILVSMVQVKPSSRDHTARPAYCLNSRQFAYYLFYAEGHRYIDPTLLDRDLITKDVKLAGTQNSFYVSGKNMLGIGIHVPVKFMRQDAESNWENVQVKSNNAPNKPSQLVPGQPDGTKDDSLEQKWKNLSTMYNVDTPTDATRTVNRNIMIQGHGIYTNDDGYTILELSENVAAGHTWLVTHPDTVTGAETATVDGKAVTQLIFVGNNANAVVPVGTRVSTDTGIVFETTNAVSLSSNEGGGYFSSPEVQGSAIQSGLSGNTGVYTINTFVGTAPTNILSVSNVTPATGGHETRAWGIAGINGLLFVSGQSGAQIPAGTVVSTADIPPIQFKTTCDAVTGADCSVEVSFVAVNYGSSSNVGAGTINVVPDALDNATPGGLAVTNPNAVLTGTDNGIGQIPLCSLPTRLETANSTPTTLVPNTNLVFLCACMSEDMATAFVSEGGSFGCIAVKRDYMSYPQYLQQFYCDYLVKACSQEPLEPLGGPGGRLQVAISSWEAANDSNTSPYSWTTGYWSVDQLVLKGNQNARFLPAYQ